MPMGFFAAVVAGTILVSCAPELDMTGKTLCATTADCLDGYRCVANRCVVEGALDTMDGTPTDTSTDAAGDVWRDTARVDSGPLDTTTLPDVPHVDTDQDGVFDALDNCRAAPNARQEDYDRNGVGDVCQADERTHLVITEVMANPESGIGPVAGGSYVREWQLQYVEVYNAGTVPVDLAGFVLSNQAGTTITLPETMAHRVEPAGFYLISGSPLAGGDGASTLPGYAHGNGLFRLAQGIGADGSTPFETLRLAHPLLDDPSRGAIVFDEVKFYRPFVRGSAAELSWAAAIGQLPADANNASSLWCASWYAPGPGRDGGSPGAANGPCYEPLEQTCGPEGFTDLPLGKHVFGDISDPSVASININNCVATTTTMALARELTYRVTVPQATTVTLMYTPVPNVMGDQNGTSTTLDPWYGMVYWRQDVCPQQPPPPSPPSICLSPTDQAITSNLVLNAATTYYFTVDGQRRALGQEYEEGRFTFALIPQ